MDPVSHVVFAWCLNESLRKGPAGPDRTRGRVLASVLGSLSPDIDSVVVPAGWDRYLAAHEVGTHSAVGAIACGVLAAGVAMIVCRQTAYRRLVIPSVIGAASHIVGDLLSGASIRVGWPFVDGRVTSVGVFGMGEPMIVAWSILGGILLLVLTTHRARISMALLIAFALLVGTKTALREHAESEYREQRAYADAVGPYMVEPVWGTMTRWRVFDRTREYARSWTIDSDRHVELVLQVPLATGDPSLIRESRLWETVRNFRGAHDFAFAVATPAGVEWSDLRYCSPGRPGMPVCRIWAGGQIAAAPQSPRLIVRVGNLVQTR